MYCVGSVAHKALVHARVCSGWGGDIDSATIDGEPTTGCEYLPIKVPHHIWSRGTSYCAEEGEWVPHKLVQLIWRDIRNESCLCMVSEWVNNDTGMSHMMSY